MSLVIRSFEPCDQAAARRLIQAGLGKHFGWIDETRNPDLDDIAGNYVEQGHAFFVAEIGGELVGTAALVAESDESGRIVRMSVSKAHRRRGIGRALVTHVLDVARRKGFRRIRVETNNGWEDAIGLYRDCGFCDDHCDETGVHLALLL